MLLSLEHSHENGGFGCFCQCLIESISNSAHVVQWYDKPSILYNMRDVMDGAGCCQKLQVSTGFFSP